jgi:hypothetical protein
VLVKHEEQNGSIWLNDGAPGTTEANASAVENAENPAVTPSI